MKPRQFYDLAKNMRHAQKMFFSTKDKAEKQRWLIESKNLEKEMDTEISRVEAILAKKEDSKQRMDNAVKLLEANGFEVVGSKNQ